MFVAKVLIVSVLAAVSAQVVTSAPTLIDLAILLGGPVVAGLFSVLIERVPQFKELSSTGKALINSTFSLVAGLASAFAVSYFTAHPEVVEAAQPTLNLVLPTLSLFVNQLVHLFTKPEKPVEPVVIGDV